MSLTFGSSISAATPKDAICFPGTNKISVASATNTEEKTTSPAASNHYIEIKARLFHN